jgi:dihydroorotate dehydrogenase (fumarate)
MPAAGWCKTVEQVRALAKIPYISHIVAGSFTADERVGNAGGTNFAILPDGTSVNSLGLPNKGRAYLKKRGGEMIQIAHDAGKLAVISIAGETAVEYMALAMAALEIETDIIELNAGCPNVYGADNKQKSIPSYNLELLGSILRAVRQVQAREDVHLWVKLSPYADPAQRVAVAQLIADVGADAVTTCNTFPSFRPLDHKGKPLLDVTQGRGGMAGTSLKPIAQLNAEHFRELLPEHIDVIGVGGLRGWQDIRERLATPCSAVQVGTAFFANENFGLFEYIATEWADHFESTQATRH